MESRMPSKNATKIASEGAMWLSNFDDIKILNKLCLVTMNFVEI